MWSIAALTNVQSAELEIIENWFAIFRRACIQSDFEVSPLMVYVIMMLDWQSTPHKLTVSSSLFQLWTTVLGAMIRQVGHFAFAGGNFLSFSHSGLSWSLETLLRLLSSSRLSPNFFMIADRNDITCIVFPTIGIL